MTECKRCAGDPEADGLVCQMCEGEGIYEYDCSRETGIGGDYETDTCEDCRGVGYIECPDCLGTGEPVDPTGC